jgi:type I restriction enzyme S subunit
VLPTAAAEPWYLYYWSRTIRPWLEENSSATTVSIINKGRFSEAPIKLATLAEQRRIVAKIDSLSTRYKRARDHLDHVTRLAEKYKQAILAAAFRGE